MTNSDCLAKNDFETCSAGYKARGLCKKHYMRWQRTGDPTKTKRRWQGNGATHPLYDTWNSMVSRCHNPNDTGYRNYGERGITVCDAWRASLFAFIAHVGVKPDGMTLDRIDNDGDYRPGNVRWATIEQQQSNKRLVRKSWAALTDEEVRTIRNVSRRRTRTSFQLSEDYGVSFGTIRKIVRKERYRYVEDSVLIK